MEEPYVEGVATHDDRKPCVGVRKAAGEASVAARMGRVIEPRNHSLRGADAVVGAEGNIARSAIRELWVDPARSKTPCTCGTSMHENREIPVSPVRPIIGRAAQERPRSHA